MHWALKRKVNERNFCGQKKSLNNNDILANIHLKIQNKEIHIHRCFNKH